MGSKRVLRGGSWNNDARNARAANRNGNDPDNRNDNVGFRLARAQERADAPASDPTLLATVWRMPGGKKEMGPGVLVGSADALSNARRVPAPAAHLVGTPHNGLDNCERSAVTRLGQRQYVVSL